MPRPKEMQGVKNPKKWTTLEEHLMAYRYLYYVKSVSVIPDTHYDLLENDCIESDDFDDSSPISRLGSSNKECYPRHIRFFAMYLLSKYMMKVKPKKKLKKKGLLK